MQKVKTYSPGIILTVILALASIFISNLIPGSIIGASVFALLIGMAINPLIREYDFLKGGLTLVSKKILRLGIILMGARLSFGQVLEVGKYSIIVMVFTLSAAFGGGYLLGKLFKMDWKLSGLLSAGTGICGASAVAAISESIDAEPRDVAYAISATFIFDVLMVILFPLMGRYLNMSDLGFGLWAGTAINDTSSVVAASYAFSDPAGNFAIIVKLTRTLSIIPAVLIFSFINEKVEAKKSTINWVNIFPWFILMFLGVVGLKSFGLISDKLGSQISEISKFLMVMALGAIGLKTNFKEISKSGFLPMVHGFLISALVVIVSLLVQIYMGQV